MGRTLIYIPKMFDRGEFKKLTGTIPEDFDEVSEEFWNYIEEKLKALSGNVQRVYCKESLDDMKKILETSEGNWEYKIIRRLVEGGADLTTVEDPLLVAETEAWLEMMEISDDQGASELFKDGMREMDEYVVKRIDQTLEDGEIGVLIIDPGSKLSFPEDVRVVKMCRFDPEDYLKRWKTKLKLR